MWSLCNGDADERFNFIRIKLGLP